MENVSIFYDHLKYFRAIWYSLWPFGLVCGHLVYFWYVWITKNLATLKASLCLLAQDVCTCTNPAIIASEFRNSGKRFLKTIFAENSNFPKTFLEEKFPQKMCEKSAMVCFQLGLRRRRLGVPTSGPDRSDRQVPPEVRRDPGVCRTGGRSTNLQLGQKILLKY
jgi:hypothetical protein